MGIKKLGYFISESRVTQKPGLLLLILNAEKILSGNKYFEKYNHTINNDNNAQLMHSLAPPE